ncbi:hypothetical protein [Hyphomicrobium sp. D-2]|uniref:hypothetical protein n=1 Tax=Hyphomicrobium sp. D-2 TaxID=3041621 RepID=UPI002456E90B|nr:hypothetical protein [Hyphomicrobium sp. D-2]MDH4983776.1 hypothetical protein [Hyphomicrobium sp. D-2]
MFFTHLCRVIAAVGLFFGTVRVGFGIAGATGVLNPEALDRYTGELSSGAVLDSGLLVVFVAVLVGTLAEISLTLRRRG